MSQERPPRRVAVDSEEDGYSDDDEFLEKTNRTVSGVNEKVTFNGASQPQSVSIPP